MNTDEGIIMQYYSKNEGVSCSDNKIFTSSFSTPIMHPGVLVGELGCSRLIDRVTTEQQRAELKQSLFAFIQLFIKYLLSDYYAPCTVPRSVSQKRQDPHFHRVYILVERDSLNKYILNI